MCDEHRFDFDVDQAYADQLIFALQESPSHPLTVPGAPGEIGVYALYRSGDPVPVYVGQAVGAQGVRARLRDHRQKIEHRQGIDVNDMSCKYLLIARLWEITRAEQAPITRHDPSWNGIPGFSMHVAGRGRPGMPGYVNEWDRMFPRE